MRARVILFVCALAACGDDATTTGVTTDHCTYEPLPATARAGGMVMPGALQAGAAEKILHIPVGTALGGYTARAGFLGSAGVVDARKIKISGAFNPSVGVLSAPRVKAVALTAGEETVIILKFDSIFVYEGMLFDLEQRLGPDYAGKVIIAASHSHSAWAQHSGHGPLKLGSGQLRQLMYDRYLADFEATAREALAARKPAKLGVFYDANFDPMNQVNRDRRGDNNMLPGGDRKDNQFFMIRIDGTDGSPIAALPIFGAHPVLNGEDNPFASSDADGALERVFQEEFDTKVVVMRLQSAVGDNSAVGHGHLDCNNKPGASSDPCFGSWTAEEGHGRAAAPIMMAAWTAAGSAMRDSLELEMVTRSIETGPKPSTFSVRNSSLVYAPFDISREPDGVIMNGTTLASPVDEFNAPVGAALCETENAMFPAAAIPGVEGQLPYGSCLRLDVAGEILGEIFSIDFGVTENQPVCETTRTTISALRIGDYLIGTMPGELTVMLADYLRRNSPAGVDKTILLGTSQGHVGYILTPEDWVLGGYEASVTFWGPLEGEYISEQLVKLMPLALSPMRENAATESATKVKTATIVDDFEVDDPAPMAGTVPGTVPSTVWARTGTPTQAQPAATIPRVAGVATFVWIGDDPAAKTPNVTLQYEMSADVWAPVARRSGRLVEDNEIVIAYTPNPLQRSGPQTHYWVAEWQALPWVGTVGLATFDDRGGVATGRYRFHVEGKGWTLDSDPFQVVEGGLSITAARAGNQININVRWHAPKGWRLMDPGLMSNQPVPVRSQIVNVQILNAADLALNNTSNMTSAGGAVTVSDVANSAKVRVRDRFGNEHTVTL